MTENNGSLIGKNKSPQGENPDKVLTYLRNHPNEAVHARMVMGETGLSYGQVTSSLRTLVRVGSVEKTDVSGWYKLASSLTSPAQRRDSELILYEKLRVRSDGSLVLVDEDGDLWVAKKVDV